MKTLYSFLFSLLLLISTATAQRVPPQFVGAVAGKTSGSSLTLPVSFTPGGILFLGFASGGGNFVGPFPISITDDAGSVWRSASEPDSLNAANICSDNASQDGSVSTLTMCAAYPIANNVSSVTITASGSGFSAIVVEYKGMTVYPNPTYRCPGTFDPTGNYVLACLKVNANDYVNQEVTFFAQEINGSNPHNGDVYFSGGLAIGVGSNCTEPADCAPTPGSGHAYVINTGTTVAAGPLASLTDTNFGVTFNTIGSAANTTTFNFISAVDGQPFLGPNTDLQALLPFVGTGGAERAKVTGGSGIPSLALVDVSGFNTWSETLGSEGPDRNLSGTGWQLVNAGPSLQTYELTRTLPDIIGDNPALDIPVRDKEGHPSFTYKLEETANVYTLPVNNSVQWVVDTKMVGIPSPSLVKYGPKYPTVVPEIMPPAYVPSLVGTFGGVNTVGNHTELLNSWYYMDARGMTHVYADVSAVEVSGSFLQTDGSGYTLGLGGSIAECGANPCIIAPNGDSYVSIPNVSNLFRGTVATYTDPNGVKLSAYFSGDGPQTVVYYDSMVQAVLRATQTNANSTPPTGDLPTNVYGYTDSTGKLQKFTVKYGLYSQRTNFGCSDVADMPATSAFLPSSVTLPDNSSYTIAYEPTVGSTTGEVTGRILSYINPGGGATSYQYCQDQQCRTNTSRNAINCADGSIPVLKTTTPDGGTWISIHTLN